MDKHKPTPTGAADKHADAKKPIEKKEAMKPGKPGHGSSKN